MDDESVLAKENFFKYSRCAWCHSTHMLELDIVIPFVYPPQDIWSWPVYKRESYIYTEAQVLCSPCYLRKKRMWNQFKKDNDPWFQAFVV